MCPSISPSDYARLMDAAKRQANVLRDQAVSNFWRQAGNATRRALMATHRLARSLAGHGQPDKQQDA